MVQSSLKLRARRSPNRAVPFLPGRQLQLATRCVTSTHEDIVLRIPVSKTFVFVFLAHLWQVASHTL